MTHLTASLGLKISLRSIFQQAHDIKNGAAVTLVPSIDGTVLLKIEGKVAAEIAPSKIKQLTRKLDPKGNGGLSLNFVTKDQVIVFEY